MRNLIIEVKQGLAVLVFGWVTASFQRIQVQLFGLTVPNRNTNTNIIRRRKNIYI